MAAGGIDSRGYERRCGGKACPHRQTHSNVNQRDALLQASYALTGLWCGAWVDIEARPNSRRRRVQGRAATGRGPIHRRHHSLQRWVHFSYPIGNRPLDYRADRRASPDESGRAPVTAGRPAYSSAHAWPDLTQLNLPSRSSLRSPSPNRPTAPGIVSRTGTLRRPHPRPGAARRCTA